MFTIDRDEIPRLLSELAQQRHLVAQALLDLDTTDDGLAYLRTAPLGGVTRELWDRLRPRIDGLWIGFRAFGATLDTAGPRPTRAQLTSVAALLSAPATADGLPDELRTVPAADLGRWLEEECRQVRAALSAVSGRLAAVIDLTALENTVDALARDAGSPAPAAGELRALRIRASADPLGTDLESAEAKAAVASAQRTVEDLNRLVTARAAYPARRAALRDTLIALTAAETDVAGAYAHATAKIRDPRLPDVVVSAPGLRRRLDTLERLSVSALDQALPALEGDAAAALDRARQCREFAEGLLGRREELRGRLEAYRMKAVRSGRSERPGVLGAYADARALLWTAPCDLAAATRAVVTYQRFLADDSGGGAA